MDVIDRASELEERQRAAAIAAHCPNYLPERVRIDRRGKRLCIDCDDPIEKQRLKAQPNAVRCLSCQADYERRHRR